MKLAPLVEQVAAANAAKGILQKAVAGNVPSSDEQIDCAHNGRWLENYFVAWKCNEAQLGAMNQVNSSKLPWSQELLLKRRAFGEQEPEWLKNEYASLIPIVRCARVYGMNH